MGRNHGFFSTAATAGICAGLALGLFGCNEHDVRFQGLGGDVEVVIPEAIGGGQEIDILWMIDNSGSMCRSQEIIRNSIGSFVEILEEVNIDFHIGITTTHPYVCADYAPGDPEYPAACDRETVANLGHLQSTPQPIPGFDRSCFHPVFGPSDPAVTADPNNAPHPGDPDTSSLAPILENISAGVDCTADPGQWQHLLNPDQTKMRCSLSGTPGVSEADCAPYIDALGEGEELTIEDFFPPSSAYRPIPRVLRRQDYTLGDGTFDIDSFADDFACASLVGTRGYGYEMGLKAVATAFSPELTGGPTATIEDQANFPNAGFVRPTAQTGVIFITDENDCSHDGTLNESTACGVSNCTINENLGADGAIIPIRDLYSDFILNLADARGLEIDFSENESYSSIRDVAHIDDLTSESDTNIVRALNSLAGTVLPASVHAPFQLVPSENIPPEDCSNQTTPWHVSPSCVTTMGQGWSGHRYEYFLREFPLFFPEPDSNNPERPLDGLVCSDFSQTLNDIADFFRAEASGCISDIWPCTAHDQCPFDPYAPEDADRCVAYPGAGSNSSYCQSAIEVRLVAPNDEPNPAAALDATGYCASPVGDDPAFPRSCVIDPSRYFWTDCPERSNAISLDWVDSDWQLRLAGFSMVTRFVSRSVAPSDGSAADEPDEEIED